MKRQRELPGHIPATRAKRLLHALELLLLLGGTPLLLLSLHGHTVRHLALVLGCLYAIVRLYGKVSFRRLFSRPPAGRLRGPLLRGLCVFLAAALYVYCTDPASLFALPRRNPYLWGLLLILYPLISVLAQELVYRVYIFEVHGPLWTSPAQPLIVSALLFSWVHIIYAGWFALVSTGLAGLALGLVYLRGRDCPGALWPVLLEHSCYGLTMFTVGLGKHFYLARTLSA